MVIRSEQDMRRSGLAILSSRWRPGYRRRRPCPAGPRSFRRPSSRLGRLEERIPEGSFREHLLKQLHGDAVNLFVNSPGFGATRMIRPTERGLRRWLREEPVPSQPGPRFQETGSPGEWKPTAADDEPPMGDLLEVCIEDFVNPKGFGYFKDRRHVAGFESHRFSRVPEPANRWKLQALELVSLLLHDEPRVYVSDRLPEMDRMHGTPTRPLDRFERFALDRLRQGEDILATETDEGLRMLGAVRSGKQCVKCHGGDRGDLLGAFSYALRGRKGRGAMNRPGHPVVRLSEIQLYIIIIMYKL